jgi:hypothetical protein
MICDNGVLGPEHQEGCCLPDIPTTRRSAKYVHHAPLVFAQTDELIPVHYLTYGLFSQLGTSPRHTKPIAHAFLPAVQPNEFLAHRRGSTISSRCLHPTVAAPPS